jgi:hypothetical protein
MANTTLQVLIDIKSKLEGLEQAVAQMRQLKNETANASSAGSALSGVLSGLAAGAGIQLTQQLSQIPQILIRAAQDGVNFNATIESAQIGIASIIKAFDTTGTFKNFDAALNESARAVAFLKSKAVETEATFQELLEGYQSAAGPAFAVGINSTREQIKLTVALSQAMSALTIPAREMSQEIRGVFEGDTSRQSRLNRVLQITKAEMDQAALSGKAYQLVMDRIRSFTEGAQRGQQTYNVAMSNFGDIITQLKAAGTENLFEQIRKKVLEVNKELSKDQTREAVVGWSAAIGSAVEQTGRGIKAISSAIDQVNRFLVVPRKVFEIERDLLRGSFSAPGKDAERAEAEDFLKKTHERQAAIEQLIRLSGPLEERLEAHRAIQSLIVDLTKRTKDENALIASIAQQTIPFVERYEFIFDKIREQAQAIAVATKLTKEQIEAAVVASAAMLETQRQTTIKLAQASGDKSGEFAARAEDIRVDTFNKLVAKGLPYVQAARDAEAVANATRDALQAQEDVRDAAKDTTAEHRDITAVLRQQETTMQGIRQQQELINQNPFLTLSEKNAQLLVLMREEITALNLEVAKGQALLSGGTLDPATYEQVAQKVQQAQFEIELLSQKTQTLNFGGGLKANLLEWVNSMGTAAQQVGHAITSSIGTAIDATANALTDLVFATGNWRQTMLQAEKAIVGSLIKIGLQMIAQKVLGSILGRQGVTETTANNAEVLSTATPAAVAQSGASSGFNWVFAGIAAAAAIALIIGLLAGGFEHGGHTGFVGSKMIAGVVHGQEYVQPKKTVDFYGLASMAAIHQRRIPAEKLQALVSNYSYPVTPRLGSFEMGGAVAAITESAASNESSSRAVGETKLSNYLVFDRDELRKQILNDDAAEIWVTDVVNRKSYRIRKT